MRRLIAGCGYLGSRVARLWHAGGDEVHVLTRSTLRAGHFRQLGWYPSVGDVTRPETLPHLPPVDTVLWSVGFDQAFDQAARQTVHDIKVTGLGHFLRRLSSDVGRFILISSTGVYGQTDGSDVDELTECRPQRAGGQASLAAEQLLLRSPVADRSVILRLAGIYGPERLPRLKQLQAGQPLETAPADLLNLIHVDDAAQVILRAAECQLPLPRVFLVADGQPVERATFYAEAARLWQTPPAVYSAVHDGARSHRGGGNKRVSSARMQAELGVTLRYPSYREGLAAIRRDSRLKNT